jgi:hypothetical protein
MQSPFFRSPDVHRLKEHPLYKKLLADNGEDNIENYREFCKVFSLWTDGLEVWIGHPRELHILSTAILRCLKFQFLVTSNCNRFQPHENCLICHEKIAYICKKLDCGHSFHPWCLLNWKYCSRFETCPTCTVVFTSSSNNLMEIPTTGKKYPFIVNDNIHEEFKDAFSLGKSHALPEYDYHCIERCTPNGKVYYTVPTRVILQLKYILLECRKKNKDKQRMYAKLSEITHHLSSSPIYSESRKSTPSLFISQFVHIAFKKPAQRVDDEFVLENRYAILLLLIKWWLCSSGECCDFPYSANIFPCECMGDEESDFEMLKAQEYCERMICNDWGWKNRLWVCFALCLRGNASSDNRIELEQSSDKLLRYLAGYTIPSHNSAVRGSVLVSYRGGTDSSNHCLHMTKDEQTVIADIEDFIQSNIKNQLTAIYALDDTGSERSTIITQVQGIIHEAFKWVFVTDSTTDTGDINQLKVSNYLVHRILNRRLY